MLAAQSRPTSPPGPAWISSIVGLRTPRRTMATGRPSACATRSGGSVGLSVKTGTWSLGKWNGIA